MQLPIALACKFLTNLFRLLHLAYVHSRVRSMMRIVGLQHKQGQPAGPMLANRVQADRCSKYLALAAARLSASDFLAFS